MNGFGSHENSFSGTPEEWIWECNIWHIVGTWPPSSSLGLEDYVPVQVDKCCLFKAKVLVRFLNFYNNTPVLPLPDLDR